MEKGARKFTGTIFHYEPELCKAEPFWRFSVFVHFYTAVVATLILAAIDSYTPSVAFTTNVYFVFAFKPGIVYVIVLTSVMGTI